MADPVKYVPDYSFANFQAGSPADPLPADRLDTELANIQQTTDELVDAVTDVRRADGALRNEIVTVDSLSPAVAAMLGDTEDLAAIAGALDAIVVVAGATAEVAVVAENVADVNTVAGVAPAVSAVAANTADISTVAGITENIAIVAGDHAAVAALGAISNDIATVAGLVSEVSTVAGIAAEVETVAGDRVAVTAVAVISEEVAVVAVNAASVVAVAEISADISAVAAIAEDIQEVANALDTANFATAEQGEKADTAVQPEDLGSAAFESASAFATAAQGAKADTAVQPADIAALAVRAGTVRATLCKTPEDGWIFWFEGTIGDTGSGATEQGPEFENLFGVFYAYDDDECPLLTSDGDATTRGAQGTVTEAWEAGCRVTVLPAIGDVIGIAGTTARGGRTSREAGDEVGVEKVTLTANEQASMSVSGSATVSVSGATTSTVATGNTTANYNNTYDSMGPAVNSLVKTTVGVSASGSGAISGTAAGGGQAHENMQPTRFLNMEIKL